MTLVKRTLKIGLAGLLISAQVQAQNMCHDLFSTKKIEIAHLEKPLTEELERELLSLVEKDSSLEFFLKDSDFIHFIQGVSQKRKLDELRPYLNGLWKNESLQNTYLPSKTGALLVGPLASNSSKLINILMKAELEKFPEPSKVDKFKFAYSRIKTQLLGLRDSLKRQSEILDQEMHPSMMDTSLFAFYGYVNLGLKDFQLRQWDSPTDSYQGVKLSDVKHIDPVGLIKVLMLASQIEQPVNDYSGSSGQNYAHFPQVQRFMGKSKEQEEFHKKSGEKSYCTNGWCNEENRHEMALENLARRLTGIVLANNRPFTSDKSLDPSNPLHVKQHTAAKANNENAATSAYAVAGSHSVGNTSVYLKNVRGDEIKHSTIFAGLYHYMYGNRYWSRLAEVIKIAAKEAKQKGNDSEYAFGFFNEPITAIEFLTTSYKYEKKIKSYMSLVPLKTMRKIFETQINVEPLNATALRPEKEKQHKLLTQKAEIQRQALASWPKQQREAADALERFELNNLTQLNDLTGQFFNQNLKSFDYGSEFHRSAINQINKITAGDLAQHRIEQTNENAELVKRSLHATLRDYQIMNNKSVRARNLSVVFVDVIKGFEVIKNDEFKAQERVRDSIKSEPRSVAETDVLSLDKINNSWVLRINKPADFVFKAGQSVDLEIKTLNQGKTFRTFSISNSPKDNYIEFATRESETFYKEAFGQLKKGDKVGLSQPAGNLNFDSTKPAVFIAGGVGITPFKGILQSLSDGRSGRQKIQILYSNRNAQATMFKSELDQFVSQLNETGSAAKIDYIYTESQRRIDEESLRSIELAAQSRNELPIYYLSGTTDMVNNLKMLLKNIGVDLQTRVRAESFGASVRSR